MGLFGRKAPAMAAVDPVAAADDVNIPLIDPQGHGFELLRSMNFGHAVWRSQAPADLDRLGGRQIILVAAYSPADIEASRPLMQRFMTVVLAMGLGPHYGSRALSLGAMGYIDASAPEDNVKGLFGDAVARIRMRRLREAAA